MPSLPVLGVDWQQLSIWLREADIDSLEIASPGRLLRMNRGDAGYQVEVVPPQDLQAQAEQLRVVPVPANCAGIFLDRLPGSLVGFAGPGEAVQAGETLALQQVGLLLIPVVAPVGGRRGRTLVTAGTLVGYGKALLEILAGEA